jgi:diguanylate cyclase (GGDEF)-like protein
MVQNPKGGQNFELTLLDGRFFDIRRSAMPDGGYVSTTTDITARRRIEAELGARNQFVESVLRSISQGIVALDRNKQIVAWNDQYRDFFDLPVDLLRPGVPRSAIITHLTERGYFGRRYLDANARMQIDEPQPDQRFEIRLPDGRVLDIRREPLPEDGIVTTYTDITEQKRAEDTIRRLALLDPLTGLANRARFDQRLAEAIGNAVENQSRVALLLIDLDHFKPVNDTHGHAVGDVVLRRVGRILAQTVRDIDTAARIGGDEFAVILPHLPDTSVAERIAQRIIESIQLPIAIDELTVTIGASVGIAIAPDNGSTPESLRELGDAALYLAKGAGRGVWRRAA